jgi:hypothetical protein
LSVFENLQVWYDFSIFEHSSDDEAECPIFSGMEEEFFSKKI